MLDPITAVGLAGNVVQFIDFTASVLKESYKLAQSGSVEPASNEALSRLTQSQRDVCERINATTLAVLPSDLEECAVKSAVDACEDTSAQLIALLKRLAANRKADGSVSRMSQFGAVLKTKAKGSRLEGLQAQLERSQSNLTTSLLALMRRDQIRQCSEIREMFESMATNETEILLKHRDDLLRAFETHITSLKSGPVENTSPRDRAEGDLEPIHLALEARHDRHDRVEAELLHEVSRSNRLHEEQTYAKQQLSDASRVAQSVLKSLRFPQIDQRREDIVEAACRTFSWTLSDSRSGLRSWLQSGTGIFWIKGKPGAGKSTLMKFLTNAAQTNTSLEDWANGSKLVVAEHYFWYPGTTMQKSHVGLYRSLLSSILAQDGKDRLLMRAACPQRWKQASSGEQDDEYISRKTWSQNELLQALLALGSIPSIKVCLFIDGLDEYYPHSDHDKLVNDLRRLAALPNIKLCVSSRPWTVFEQGLTNSRQMIVLEEMTRKDIRIHVWEQLRSAERLADTGRHDIRDKSDAATQLVEMITKKSEGVFLWVHLIVRSLAERLAAGQSISSLRRYVKDFPGELETYFRELIYERISPTWREHSETACALKLAVAVAFGKDICGGRSYLNYWLLLEHDNLSDPDFAEKIQFERVSDLELGGRRKATARYLHASCKDLLRTRSLRSDDSGYDRNYVQNYVVNILVEFMHRTVYDFVMTESMQRMINERVPAHFHNDDFLDKLAIARLKTIPSDEQKVDLCLYHSNTLSRLEAKDHLTTEARNGASYYSQHFCNCGGIGRSSASVQAAKRELPSDYDENASGKVFNETRTRHRAHATAEEETATYLELYTQDEHDRHPFTTADLPVKRHR